MPSRDLSTKGPLPVWQRNLCIILSPFLALTLAVGCLGLWVITDKEMEYGISRSRFGKVMRQIIQINPFIMVILVNGSMLSLLLALVSWSNDNKWHALQLDSSPKTSTKASKKQAKKIN